MVIQGDAQLERTHLLLELIEYSKVTINSIILCDQLKERDSYIAKHDVITLIDHIFISYCRLRLIIIKCRSLIQILSAHVCLALPLFVQFLFV